MTNNVWFITGAGRGMGLDITKAALAAGHKVVATGRNTDKVAQAVGESANLLVVKLDVTNPADAESAVKAVIDRFGRIDVLVNNAASFYAGYFEEITPEQMRKQRSGRIISISASAGLTGFEYCTAYSASKFGLEGWMESLQAEVEPFGIQTMVINPGFFRTELLTEESTTYAKTLITLTSQKELPRRFIAGADAIGTAEQKVALLQQQINAYHELSTSLAYEDA